MILYFTATGNSLWVARQLENQPVSIPQELRRAARGEQLEYHADTVGIVCPVYAHMLPGIVKEFLKHARIEAPYVYLVLTHGGFPRGAQARAAAECAERGLRLNLVRDVEMVDDFLPEFDMDAQRAIDRHIPKQVLRIRADIARRICDVPELTLDLKASHELWLSGAKDMLSLNHGELLRAGEGCKGCGVCIRVCPRGNLSLKEGPGGMSPRHSGGLCELCLACVQACPTGALGLSVPEPNPHARYRCPGVTLRDIEVANFQRG